MNHYSNENIKTQIKQAVTLLKQGELVVFPTETVYGLGADATNNLAIQRIYDIKKRPRNHPLIVHIADITELENWAININQIAWRLAKVFWPGPLTLILNKAPHVLSNVTGGHDTIAIRIPSHPIAQKLLQLFGNGIAAPSANYFGKLSPTEASHVQKGLGAEVKLTIDGGRCKCGLESTIVDVTSNFPKILRLGAISVNSITLSLGGKSIHIMQKSNIPAPGTLAAHYAPNTPLHIIPLKELHDFVNQLLLENKLVIVLARRQPPFPLSSLIQWIVMPQSPLDYAHELYARLHEADDKKYDNIVIEMIPEDADWLAINDRLKKAELGSKVVDK